MAKSIRTTVQAGLLALLVVLTVLPTTSRADVQCDGVDDALLSGVPVSTFVTAGDFTITATALSAVTLPEGSGCYDTGLLVGDDENYVALGRQTVAGSQACGYVFDGSTQVVEQSLPLGWHQLTLTSSAGALTISVDGVQSAPLSTAGIEVLTGLLTVCGNQSVGTGFSFDRLAEVRLYNTVVDLTPYAQSRLRLVQRGTPTAHWPLTDCAEGASGDGVLFRDHSGNNRHLTGNNGPDDAGLTCQASAWLSKPLPIQ